MRNPGGKNYTLGSGKLYFAMFAAGTQTPEGYRYFGNTPEFTNTSDHEELEHFDSDNGQRFKDDSVTLSNSSSGAFTTDNISLENVAMYYLGDVSQYAQLAATAKTETIKAVKRGRYYQLGVTEANPAGTRHVTNVEFKIAAAEVAIPNNFELDLATGRFYVEDDAPGIAPAGVELIVTYDQIAYTQERVISKNNSIVGALFFEATTQKGLKFDYTWPYVKISPDGDYNLKSMEDWAAMSFTVEFLQKSGYQTVYITDRGVAAPAP